MMLSKEIDKLKKDIAELEGWLNTLKADLDKKTKKFSSEANDFAKELDTMANQYIADVYNCADTYNPELKREISKVLFRKPSNWKGKEVYEYFPASIEIAKFCERSIGKSVIIRSDPRITLIQETIVADNLMITIGETETAKYSKKFLTTVLFLVLKCGEDIDKALNFTRELLEGREGYGIDKIDEYLYELVS